MNIQETLSERLCEPLKNMGENEAVTKTDLRRFADNLASVLADSVDLCVKGPPTLTKNPPVEQKGPPTPPPNPTAEAKPDAKQPETKTGTGTQPEGAAKK